MVMRVGGEKTILSALSGAVLAGFLAALVLRDGAIPDFVVFWAAQQVPNPYDTGALRAAIEATGGFKLGPTVWPYPYPPTFLLISSWLGLMTYPVAYVAWSALGGASMVAASQRLVAPLVLLTPWVSFAIGSGQTSVLMGALIYGALAMPSRPLLAGALLGIAACIKPQLGVFIPFGLAVAGQWRTIGSATLVVLSVCGATTLIYGVEAWRAWLAILPKIVAFSQTVEPHMDLPSWPLRALALAVGLPLGWRAFKGGDPADKLITACGTALLVMPHSLWYNTAVLAPGAVGLLGRDRWRGAGVVALFLFKPTSLLIAALIGLAALPRQRPAERRRPSDLTERAGP